MSAARQSQYGTRTFDLSEQRNLKRVDIRADQFAILRADDSAEIRINDPQNAPIEAREISSITIPPTEGRENGIERLYISNSAGTGELKLLTGFGGTSGSTDPPSGDEVDITNREAREIGKARMQDSGGVLIDPATDGSSSPDKRDVSEFTAAPVVTDTDSGTGSANAASIQLGSLRKRADIHVDTSGSATLTVEVSTDGSTWLEFETVDYSAATVEVEAFDVAFEHVRSYLDQNRNGITMSAKGI